jgi:hypothetical protein
MLMLMLPFLTVVVRVMPSDFESASSEGDHGQPPPDEKDEYQGQRTDVHKLSLHDKLSSAAHRWAVSEITRGGRPIELPTARLGATEL